MDKNTETSFQNIYFCAFVPLLGFTLVKVPARCIDENVNVQRRKKIVQVWNDIFLIHFLHTMTVVFTESVLCLRYKICHVKICVCVFHILRYGTSQCVWPAYLANKVPIVQFSASSFPFPSLFPLERMTRFLSVRPVDLYSE